MSTLRARGIEIGYDDIGEGAPVVLLHGFPFNRSMWREQAEALRETHRIVTPDLLGHGETSVTATATMEEMAQMVAALLDELQLERVVLGGLSMGGYVTFAFYRLFPQRVRALILADTRPQADTEEGRRTREELAQRALHEGMEAIAGMMLPKVLAPTTMKENQAAVARVREMITQMRPEGTAAASRGMAVRRDQSELLAQINVPTLIIVGSEDKLTPPADAERMQRAISGARLAVMAGAGHVSNIERPADFNRALINFLATVEA